MSSLIANQSKDQICVLISLKLFLLFAHFCATVQLIQQQ